jgi:hypothetical protein
VYIPIPPDTLTVMVPSEPDPQVTGVVDMPVMITSCAFRGITHMRRTTAETSEILDLFIETCPVYLLNSSALRLVAPIKLEYLPLEEIQSFKQSRSVPCFSGTFWRSA